MSGTYTATPLAVDGFSCELIRSTRRTMALEITRDARILVRVPLFTDTKTVISFVRAHKVWLTRHLVNRPRARYQPTPDEIAELKRRAKAHIPERVAHFSEVMGLVPTAVRINAARTRFGSCGTKNALNFSCLLMRYPPAAIDYVVVHELAHLRHRNHGPAFYALVERYMPDYRERARLLKGACRDDHMD